jgi:plastocyanin
MMNRHKQRLSPGLGAGSIFLAILLAGRIALAETPDRIGIETPADPPAGTQEATVPSTVDINNFDFSPMMLTIAPGTKVTWTNHDDVPHTVVSADDPKQFRSPPLDTDDAYSFVFTKPGTYKYFCSVHPKMVGMIIVK